MFLPLRCPVFHLNTSKIWMCLPASSELLNAALMVEGLVVRIQKRRNHIHRVDRRKSCFYNSRHKGIKSKMKSNVCFFFLCAFSKKEIKGWMFFPPGSRQSEKMTVFTQKACRGNLCLSYFLIAKHVITFLFGGGPRKKERKKKSMHCKKKLIEAAPDGIKHLRTAGARFVSRGVKTQQNSAFNIGTRTLVNVRASLWGPD